jgi:sensor c-di-GMP phosphodiesterase-like protein
VSTHLLSAAHAGESSGSVLAFIFTIAIAYSCGVIAQRKRRSRLVWFILGGLFSVVALVAVLLIPRRGLAPREEILDPDRSR